jgi:mono/diheme cytochrome c family protein
MRNLYACATLLILIAFGIGLFLQPHQGRAALLQAPLSVRAANGDVERGRYLVEEVARCPECHTPRDSSGQLESSRWLQGAPIWIMPTKPNSNWAERAPDLAGFPYTDRQGQDILERGVGANGESIRPPMHIYHLKHADAIDIIAYLRSLPAPTEPQ